ncbi:Ribosomal protein S6 kinase-like 1 [Channa argus]|uniref:Ribosomal protein S6 kinase-like 1 n=1 Tax=Channa argus TaxID=215402 RepID=A0A6G1QFX5_CHAAH|nr:Ribosomal protein S6 kinase-like 1 [Channa argus]
MAKRDYLVEAAKQIRMALDSEVNEDYEASFSYYKNGVDLLLNGVQLDPNKDRREAVKRKTTQYLKRAEEIFITHLQDNLGKGSSHLGGYSSLRFRPIRHLSSPVEDLEMCKVVGVTDKVLIVQSMVNKETFVVKSLVKSSWESRDQPTIIPQGVPYMVKLLRYYVSEDTVYLHLEHVKGGRLFSKLHKLRNKKAKEHPECFSSSQHSIKLKTSYTSPTISTDYQHNSETMGKTAEKLNDESPDTDFTTSWDETQQRLESCGTHSYIEETGCLQNTRSTASFYTKLDRLTLHSGPMRTQANTRIHPPAPSLCLHSSETQETPALPLACARVSQALGVMSELQKQKAGMGLIECSSEFEEAWKAVDPTHNWGKYKAETCSSEAKEGADETCTALSSREKIPSTKEGSLMRWFSFGPPRAPPFRKSENMDISLNSEVSEGQGEDQIIEVDGWCHLPQFPTKSSTATEKVMQTCWGLPEAEVRVWGAQILLALENLHQQGILCRDLNPRNVLLTSNGKVCLTFFGQWSEVQSEISSKAMEEMYCAPEIGGVSRITEACDWWSLGALLFELLTGMPLWQLHPAGIHSHTQLLIPDHLSTAAASLLTELLQFDAGYRLGSGGGGVSDIKCHPFFSSISWKALSC